MSEVSRYKTKTEIIQKNMPRINGNNQHKGKLVVALDGGYSSVKGVSPNGVFCFPSYAKKQQFALEVVGKISPFDIQYKDNTTGDYWLVGQTAERMMTQGDVDATTDASLYTRYRYDSDVYKVIMNTGIALGLYKNDLSNEIFVQTGLPATFKDRDQNKLIASLMGPHDVSIKVGNNDWNNFKWDLDENHIFVMEQPQGTLCATAYQNGMVSDEGKKILGSNSIILDIGFGTEDIFSVRAGYKSAHQTYSDTGMRAVFDATITELQNVSGDLENLKVFEFQNYLEDGKAPYYDPDAIKVDYLDFQEILKRKESEICDKSIRRLLQAYDNLVPYQYLIVTGGSGESRFQQIKDMLSGIPNLQVLPGNINNPDLSCVYSNVLGYYNFRHAKLQKAENHAQ